MHVHVMNGPEGGKHRQLIHYLLPGVEALFFNTTSQLSPRYHRSVNPDPLTMERQLLSTFVFSVALTASAHLEPGTAAPLSQHMLEVNKEWLHHDPVLINQERMVRFNDDAERIALHLQLVQRSLAMDKNEALVPEQLGQRKALLDELSAYAQRGVFPQNEVLPFRNPIFIDPYGTACAVGQLMVASGSADLAHRIDAEMETAYIRDMHRSDVLQWATDHGFTEDELAWIQPGYASDVAWTAFPGAPTGVVNTVLVMENGDMIVAGTFTSASGLPITNVARYDGVIFHAIGNGVVGSVTCGVVHEGSIYLGGQFNFGDDVAVWDGSVWTTDRAIWGMGTRLHALHVHEGELFAGGWGSADFGVSRGAVSRLDDGGWQDLAAWFNSDVYALGSYNGALVAGGSFTMHVATYNGDTWALLGEDLDTTVYALETFNGELYAGGLLYAGEEQHFGLARLSNDSWTTVPGLHDQLTPWPSGVTEIRALTEYDGQLVFGGSFNLNSDAVIGRCIGRLGANDEIEPLGYFNNTVRTFAVDGVNLLAGGDFSQVDFATARTVVTTDMTTVGISDDDRDLAEVRPNPAADHVYIDTPENVRPTSISVVDGQGRIVLEAAVHAGDRHVLEISGLACGSYSVVLLAADGARQYVRFFKE